MTQPDKLPDGFHALTQPQRNQLAYMSGKEGVEFDLNIDPCFLTDKEEQKVIPCRTCKRVCICNRFASAGKTECTSCREGAHAPTQVREFDRSKDTHVLTDKEDTKELPCRTCGRPCVVNQFAAPAKVACEKCRKSAPRPKRTTEYNTNDKNRPVAETEVSIASERDLEWSAWTISQPFNFDPIYTPDEKAEHTKTHAIYVESGLASKVARRQAAKLEEELNNMPEKSDKPKVKERIAQLEAEISEAIAEEGRQAELARIEGERATELHRIAWMRGALAIGYKVVDRKGQPKRALVGRERNVPIPDDYLSDKGFAVATEPIQEATHA